jgi:hypothetical protein
MAVMIMKLFFNKFQNATLGDEPIVLREVVVITALYRVYTISANYRSYLISICLPGQLADSILIRYNHFWDW